MIRVLHLSTFHLSGGAGQAAVRLNEALNKVGVSSYLLVGKLSVPKEHVESLDHSTAGRALFWLRFVGERLCFWPFEKNPESRYIFSPAAVGATLADHPLVREADVIHLHWINFGFLSVRGVTDLIKLGKPIVWTLHDMWMFTGGCHHSRGCFNFQESCGQCHFLKNPSTRDLSYRVLQKKRKSWGPLSVVACSNWLADLARSSSLLTTSEVLSIPNPLDTKVFRPIMRGEALRWLGLPADKRYLLFAAAKVTAYYKGFSYLKEGLKMLKEKHPEMVGSVELLVIGGGDESLLADLPLKTHFLGYISKESDMVHVYNASSVYITPSLEDNLPNTVMEALACGTPVVGFRTGGIPEMIDHLENGYVADYKSPESLAEGIYWVLNNQNPEATALAAREKVLRNYQESVVAGKYLELYRQVLNQ